MKQLLSPFGSVVQSTGSIEILYFNSINYFSRFIEKITVHYEVIKLS